RDDCVVPDRIVADVSQVHGRSVVQRGLHERFIPCRLALRPQYIEVYCRTVSWTELQGTAQPESIRFLQIGVDAREARMPRLVDFMIRIVCGDEWDAVNGTKILAR